MIARQNKYIAGLDDRRLVGYDVTYSDDGAHIRPPPSDFRGLPSDLITVLFRMFLSNIRLAR